MTKFVKNCCSQTDDIYRVKTEDEIRKYSENLLHERGMVEPANKLLKKLTKGTIKFNKLVEALKKVNSTTLLHLVVNRLSNAKNHRVAAALLDTFNLPLTNFHKLMEIKQDGVNHYFI